MILDEYYSRIYRLAFITRYSNQFRVTNEDVAQHSFFVAAIVLQLHDEYTFDLGKALLAAICHDIPEADLGDVSYALRRNNKVLANEINKVEQEVIKKYPQVVGEGLDIFNSDSSEGHVVQLADAIQVFQYAIIEVSLGNVNMTKIATSTARRVEKLKDKLSPWKK